MSSENKIESLVVLDCPKKYTKYTKTNTCIYFCNEFSLIKLFRKDNILSNLVLKNDLKAL